MGAAMRSRRRGTHRSVRFAIAFGLLLALALSATTASAAPTTTTTTVVVTGSNISSGTGTASDTGWFTGDTRAGGDVSLVTGPSPTPLGTGSLHITTTDQNGSSQAKAQLFNYSYEGTPLADITAMSYSEYRSSASTNSAVQHVGLNIEVDYTGNGSYTTLVFEPVYQSGGAAALHDDTWQTWDAFNGGNAIWWSSHPIPGVPQAFDSYVKWSDILAANPNANIVGGIGFNNGSGWAGVSDENADALTIGVNGSTTTYDFEKTPPLVCRIWLWTNQNQTCSFTGSDWVANFFRGLSGSGWPFHASVR